MHSPTLNRRQALALLAAGAAGPALAAWPERPIKIVSPLAAGGTSDFIARLLAARLEATLRQPCIVENRPGAGSIVGVDYVAKAAPDGYTLAYLSSAVTIQPALMKLPYDLQRDLQPVSIAIKVPYVMAARPGSKYSSLDEVIAAARRGESVTYGTYGAGTPPHLIMEMIEARLGLRFTHVPYKTNSSQLVDLLGGQIDVMWDPPVSMLGHIRAGKLKPLATSGRDRAFFLPQVRSLGESIPGLEMIGWGALMAPAGVPKDTIQTLQKVAAAAVFQPEVEARLKEQGFTPVGSTADELGRVIQQELAAWRTLVRERNIRIE
ncbi:MAG TPA: tripartite tricarboxylate transporter substrate binding protein [Ramlibacter sp.]|nr:tripartite tricarboxylate transporter substrate binding protein [Ramlibacter sp.]